MVSGSEDVLGYRAGSGQTNPAVVVGGQWGVCGPDGSVTSVVNCVIGEWFLDGGKKGE